MNADEIVMWLRQNNRKSGWTDIDRMMDKSADLIESLQAELAKYDEVAAEYGIDGKTMLTLAKSQIKTARDNIKLREQLAALREQAGRQSGCEYCKDSEDLAYGHDSMQRTGRIYLDGNLLTADLYSESMAAAICFCPVCGKRLEVEHI